MPTPPPFNSGLPAFPPPKPHGSNSDSDDEHEGLQVPKNVLNNPVDDEKPFQLPELPPNLVLSDEIPEKNTFTLPELPPFNPKPEENGDNKEQPK